MTNKQRQKQRQIKAKKREKSRKRGLAAVFDAAFGESVRGAITFGPAEVEISAAKRRALMTGIRRIYRKHRDAVLAKQATRLDIRRYLGTSGHAFADLARIESLKCVDTLVERLISARLEKSLATGMGGVIEEIATLLPLSGRQQWATLDSNMSLKRRVAETLGPNIVKQIRLHGVHDCEGGKILRLVGLHLNAFSSNGTGAHYASNSLADIQAISALAKFVGASRVEVILGRAYDHGDTQPKSVLRKLADELEPKGWKRVDIVAGHPCIVSPDGTMQFRVMVGARFWGYLAKPSDRSGELDVMAMLSQVQDKMSVNGQAVVGRSRQAVVESFETAFRESQAAFLADPRYSYLAGSTPARQMLRMLGEAMTGSWKLPPP